MATVRTNALNHLKSFAPRAGLSYEQKRNFDFGPEQHHYVSQLSPYLRGRIVTETEVLSEILHHHTDAQAEKFIQEVFWRGYFRGWLEHRPWVWHDLTTYLAKQQGDIFALLDLNEKKLGPDCMRYWLQELRDTGYLHNHARMWFASIWIFTLGLPWQLGARLFMENLLDGDTASNTLSWRWVGGLHTIGKNYVARRDNILRYTDGRHDPGQLLNEVAEPPQTLPHPPAINPLLESHETIRPGGTLILHDDDFDGDQYWQNLCQPARTFVVSFAAHRAQHMSHKVLDFAQQSSQDMASEKGGEVIAPSELLEHLIGAPKPWIIPRPFVGPVGTFFDEMNSKLQSDQTNFLQPVRVYDQLVWPYCKKGFFQVKKNIPVLLETLAIGHQK